MYINRYENIGQMLNICLSDAYLKFGLANFYKNNLEEECDIHVFKQMWGSSALGFGGVGLDAMSTAYTIVVIKEKSACVYFGGTFAYKIEKTNDLFRQYVLAGTMPSIHDKDSLEYDSDTEG